MIILRTCTTIVGPNGATELVEMSGIVSIKRWRQAFYTMSSVASNA